MITGQTPMTLTPSDVRQLRADRFSWSEIAWIGDISESAAQRMFHMERSSRLARRFRLADARFGPRRISRMEQAV